MADSTPAQPTAADPAAPAGLADVRAVLPWDGPRVESLERLATEVVREHHGRLPRLGAILLGGHVRARLRRTVK